MLASRLFLLILFVLGTINLNSQICWRHKNQFDPDGKKHGYWVENSKLNPDEKTFKGWYEHGNETKRCTYYNNGVRWSKFRYVNDTLVKIRRFDEDGKLEYKGTALMLMNENEIRFCWDGEFVFYDSHRRKIRKEFYVRGIELASE